MGEESAISPEQIEHIRAAFRDFDKDNDGKITAKEVGSLMNILGQDPVPVILQDMINQADIDGNGTIDADAFVAMMTRQFKESETEEEMVEAFKLFDKDNDGKVTIAELSHIMREMGESITQEDFDEMVSYADPDNEGLIDYTALVRLMLTS